MNWSPIIEPQSELYKPVIEFLIKISDSQKKRSNFYDLTYGSFGDAVF